MAGKRKRQETLEELLERPWCYYCERDFDDLQVLSTHQREQHFHCESCNRRLNTASGLSVHTAQVHKDTVTKIRNALPGREDPGLEIFGMVGVPEDLLQAHRQSLIDGYYQLAAEHRARTGNPLPGTVKHDPTKKGKREETKEETLARLAAHRAKKQAEKEAAAQAATEATRPTQASPPTNNHATVGGSEGDDFIALESTSADALFPAQQVCHYCFNPCTSELHTNKPPSTVSSRLPKLRTRSCATADACVLSPAVRSSWRRTRLPRLSNAWNAFLPAVSGSYGLSELYGTSDVDAASGVYAIFGFYAASDVDAASAIDVSPRQSTFTGTIVYHTPCFWPATTPGDGRSELQQGRVCEVSSSRQLSTKRSRRCDAQHAGPNADNATRSGPPKAVRITAQQQGEWEKADNPRGIRAA